LAKKTEQSGNSVIVYDDQIVSQISPTLFATDSWTDAQRVMGQGGRHGAVRFVRQGSDEWAIRHYYRGGMIGRLLGDKYLWSGAGNSRSLREWQLLQDMREERLPAPVPVAARCVRSGIFYTADLVTVRIPGVVPLSSRMADGREDLPLWNAVGRCVARFHNAGFCHADLNTHNIQAGGTDEVWVLDWDKGARREPAGWLADNLRRLQRSCNKVSAAEGVTFAAANWDSFLDGYKMTLSV
jgi:3-deoxy-D-manno-octulosonic acid kinase